MPRCPPFFQKARGRSSHTCATPRNPTSRPTPVGDRKGRLTPKVGRRQTDRAPDQRRSADILVCGFWGLSSPQFVTAENIAELKSSATPQAGKPALVCPAGVWSGGMKGSLRGLVVPTVAEPPGRLRKEPARKGGSQTFDRRNTNGQ